MSFLKNGYKVVRNVVSQQLLQNLKIEFEMLRDTEYFLTGKKDKYAFGDHQSPNSFSVYSALCFDSLSLNLNTLMNQITGVTLYPTYTYARIYYEGAILDPHTDRPSCEYSSTICIDSTDLWDFFIEDKNGEVQKIKLNPGDMCVYSGCELEHWRETYNGKQHMQCFLHYVNSQGPYKNYKFDNRSMMGIGSRWNKYFRDTKNDLVFLYS